VSRENIYLSSLALAILIKEPEYHSKKSFFHFTRVITLGFKKVAQRITSAFGQRYIKYCSRFFAMNNPRRQRNRPQTGLVSLFQKLKTREQRLSKIVNAAAPFRVAARKQLLSVPNHNYQLRVFKTFRIYSKVNSTLPVVLNTTAVLAAVQNELGIDPTATAGEMVAIHSVSVYSMVPNKGTVATDAYNGLIVQLYDIEEVTTSGSNVVALFEDAASPAGITHVKAVYPVNNRPVFNRSTPATTIATFDSESGSLSVVDMDITYIRTPTTTN
jgi:hypothetical protein